MKFENVDRFVEWLEFHLKSAAYDLDAVLADVARQHDATGAEHYELIGAETKSGRPECIAYAVEYAEIGEDEWECTATFY